MSDLKIAVDVDGVLLDNMVLFCEIYNDIYRNSKGFIPRKKADLTNWDFNEEWNLSENSLWFIFDMVNKRLLFAPFIDTDAPKVMRKLKHKHKVDVLTARTEESRVLLERKLHKHRIMKRVQYKDLLIVDRKNKQSKIGLDYDIYIDDSPYLVSAVLEWNLNNKKKKTLLLYDQPWNQALYELDDKIIRVFNWREIYRVMQNLTTVVNA